MLIQGQLPNHFKRPKGISKLHQLIVALEENMPGLHIPVQSCQFLYFPFLDWEDKLHVRNNLDAKIRLPWKLGNSVLVNDKFQTPRWSSHIAKSIEEGDYIISHLHFPNSHEAQYSGFFLIMQAHHNNNQYLEQWSCCKVQRLVPAWWPMSGEHIAKRHSNKSGLFWRKKNWDLFHCHLK